MVENNSTLEFMIVSIVRLVIRIGSYHSRCSPYTNCKNNRFYFCVTVVSYDLRNGFVS